MSSDLSALYSSGDVILENPIESSAILLIVVVVCASIEYIFALGKEVNSKFFRELFSTLSEEVLVVGVLSLLLTVAASMVSSLPDQWSIMLDWVHVCLLFMAVLLIILLTAVAVGVINSYKSWTKFEGQRMRSSPESHSAREVVFRKAHEKFVACMKVYKLDPRDVSLSQYLLKHTKMHLVTLGNLSWKSWLALSSIVVLNALRTKLIPQTPSATDINQVLDTTNEAINIASFIAVCGYGSLTIFLIVHFRLSRRLVQYLTLNTSAQAESGGVIDKADGTSAGDEPLLNERETFLEDSQTFLVWRSTESTMAVIQAVFIFLVWYGAVFFLNALYHTFAQNIGLTLLLICGALAPIVVFIALVPWTLTIVAILGSFGTNLNIEAITSQSPAGATGSGSKAGAAAGGGSPSAAADGEEDDDKPRVVVETKPLRPVLLDDGDLMRLASTQRGRSNVSRSLL
jgi:hypothetical protein